MMYYGKDPDKHSVTWPSEGQQALFEDMLDYERISGMLPEHDPLHFLRDTVTTEIQLCVLDRMPKYELYFERYMLDCDCEQYIAVVIMARDILGGKALEVFKRREWKYARVHDLGKAKTRNGYGTIAVRHSLIYGMHNHDYTIEPLKEYYP